jgi:hypothetical protein
VASTRGGNDEGKIITEDKVRLGGVASSVPKTISGSLVTPTSLDSFASPQLVDAASTIVPIGMSGTFLRLAKNGDLNSVYRLWPRRTAVRNKLLRTRADLSNCNDPDWLIQFSETCKHDSGKFTKKLQARVGALEAKQLKLAGQLCEIDDELRKVAPELLNDSASLDIAVSEFAGPKRTLKAVRGEICASIIDEVKLLKNHLLNCHIPTNFAQLKQQYPHAKVLDIISGPPFGEEDQDCITHPAQWGVKAVTYATGILKRYFDVTSNETIRSYRKARRRECLGRSK